jgi:excisionase family DNA binding protein
MAQASPALAPKGPDLVTVGEAAERTLLSPAYIYRLVQRGELRALRSGRSVRIERASLDRWIEAHTG